MPFNFGDIPLILQELRRYFASKAQGTLADSALQPGEIGSTVQAYHTRLDSLSGITNADGGIEKTGANTYGRYALTTFGKSLIDDANATAAQATLNLVPGANVQAWDADLDALAAIATTGPVERTGDGTWAVSDRVRLFGGNGRGTNTDLTTTGNVTLSEGIYYYRNVTIATGHTLTINRFAQIYCSGTFTVQSGATITVSTALKQSSSRPGLTANLKLFQSGGTFGPNNPYSPHQFPIGAAGSSGGTRTGADGNITNVSLGGDGGGAIWVEANSAISVSGTITAVGGNGLGAATPTGEHISGGGGGGSGGAIMLTSLASITIASTGILSVAGGNGGNGSRATITNSRGYGGSGGGGGWVWLTAPTVTTAGSTITLSGGTAGTTASNGSISAVEAGGYGGSFSGNGGYTSTDGASGSSGQLVTRTYKAVA